MTSGSKTLAVALLLAGLILVNYLATSFPVRLDATSEKIYTLSAGTRALLSKIDEPTTLDLYFSRDASGQYVEYKNYAERVREMLRQYVRASNGKIHLNVIDPEPDTPEEEKATAAGIEPQTIPGGSQFYFGLVATQADQQKAIPALTPQREQFLEYDVSELIYGVGQTDKKKLGLITSLPLQGSPGMPMMGQQGTEGQFVVTEWEETYKIVPVEADRNRAARGPGCPRHHPSGERVAEAAVRNRPVPPCRQARLPGRRSILGLFQADGRAGGDVWRAPAQCVERPSRAARRMGYRL